MKNRVFELAVEVRAYRMSESTYWASKSEECQTHDFDPNGQAFAEWVVTTETINKINHKPWLIVDHLMCNSCFEEMENYNV